MHFQIPYHLYRSKYPTKLLALYHSLRDSILDGVLSFETRLPSSRELAAIYGLSRGTVNVVYDMLNSEGYLRSEIGRGTFVSIHYEQRSAPDRPSKVYVLSAWGKRLMEQTTGDVSYLLPAAAVKQVDFHRFAPDIGLFPQEEWNRYLHATAKELTGQGILPRADVQGDYELRNNIAQYVRRARGIEGHPSQIVLFNGSMQAIALTVQLLVNPGDSVIIENPGYMGIRRAVHTAGGLIKPVPIDGQGIIPGDWNAKLLFVTPSRQFPTGVVLSMERRQQLLKWAYEQDAIIIEDDYDSEFRHRGKSLEPLKVLDREDRVIFIGSFSKTLLTGVRIGYAVLPASLVEPIRKAKALFEPQTTGLLEQRTLAAFMGSGSYERHLRRMKRTYSRKFECLQKWLNMLLSKLFAWVEGDAGLHIFGWWLGTEIAYIEFRDQCAFAGIRWSEVALPISLAEASAGADRVKYGAYFNFPHLSEEDIEYAIKRMEEVWKSIQR
ncbi:GntR family transcriptional regulator / MocR family aminotransferase [Paenibacillus sp. 1_12]|uniref:MocR-like pyridoxine biosynthesis transcription factor PdxR n=1 Tax=Paenibacillus sp. 1_12 TaxID=1566278 RepID=UPI0008E18DA7|nr:PLP-dependent aminotransferase family protein [Paenibacillus sp. 1_12]SFK73069.1 GntR family transcriptional regulator / MocR family aminotransferase [Paenibacillus sp. 1_12]